MRFRRIEFCEHAAFMALTSFSRHARVSIERNQVRFFVHKRMHSRLI